MKITSLVENRKSDSDPRLYAEWGLSLHIEFNGKSILFDAGKSAKFARNAALLGIDIKAVDAAVLSHHHFDHGGGFRRFLEINSRAKIHFGPPPDGKCFIRPGYLRIMKRYVGLDKELLADYPERFITVQAPAEVLPGVYIIPHIAGSYPRPIGNKRLFIQKDHQLQLDDFAHEIVLAIKEDDKLVIFTGCAHNGVLNMVDTAARLFPEMPVKSVIGGFHLVASPPFSAIAGSVSDVEDLGRQVLDYPVERIYTGHCTGPKAFAVLKGVLGDRLEELKTGTCIDI